MIKEILAKFIGGNVGGNNLVTSTTAKYDEETFEFKGWSSLYDGGKKADAEGYYTYESIKDFIESKGKTKLVGIHNGRLS